MAYTDTTYMLCAAARRSRSRSAVRPFPHSRLDCEGSWHLGPQRSQPTAPQSHSHTQRALIHESNNCTHKCAQELPKRSLDRRSTTTDAHHTRTCRARCMPTHQAPWSMPDSIADHPILSVAGHGIHVAHRKSCAAHRRRETSFTDKRCGQLIMRNHEHRSHANIISRYREEVVSTTIINGGSVCGRHRDPSAPNPLACYRANLLRSTSW